MTVLKEQPYPQLAAALRGRGSEMIDEWERLVREEMPEVAGRLERLPLRGHLPDILARAADVLENPSHLNATLLRAEARERGLQRAQQHFGMADILASERCLQRAVLEGVTTALGRDMTAAETVALVLTMAVAMHEGVVAFFDRQREQLRTAAEAEAMYLSFLSHELGNGLAGTRMWLEALRRRLSRAGQFVEELEIIRKVDELMQHTLDNSQKLLQYEQVNAAAAGTHEPPEADPEHPLEVARVAAGAAARYVSDAQAKGLKIELDVTPDVLARADAGLVEVILTNLIGNAVKYCDRGTIRVRCERGEQGREKCWVLLVSDEGPGIAAERLPRLFDAFRRGDTQGRQGFGLGLAIASRAATLIGAQLTVESKPGVGTTFRLALPAAPAAVA